MSSETAIEAMNSVPITYAEMVREAARSMKEAASNGETRQIIRLLLPRDKTSGDLGKYMEASSMEEIPMEDLALAPPDESWQGGIMQLSSHSARAYKGCPIGSAATNYRGSIGR